MFSEPLPWQRALGFIASLLWKELRNLLETWPGNSQSHACLCSKPRKPEHVEPQCEPLIPVIVPSDPSHLRVSQPPSLLGMTRLVKCMFSSNHHHHHNHCHLLSICFVLSMFLYLILLTTSWARGESADEEPEIQRDEVTPLESCMYMWWVPIPASKLGQTSVPQVQWCLGSLFLSVILFSLFPLLLFGFICLYFWFTFFCFSPK